MKDNDRERVVEKYTKQWQGPQRFQKPLIILTSAPRSGQEHIIIFTFASHCNSNLIVSMSFVYARASASRDRKIREHATRTRVREERKRNWVQLRSVGRVS